MHRVQVVTEHSEGWGWSCWSCVAKNGVVAVRYRIQGAGAWIVRGLLLTFQWLLMVEEHHEARGEQGNTFTYTEVRFEG